MYINFNPNPQKRIVGDCAVRAVAMATNKTWDEAYTGLMLQGFKDMDMPSSNAVWGEFLKNHGFTKHVLAEDCPECYTLEKFCEEHPEGCYVVALPQHVVCVRDGNYYDTWDSGDEMPLYFWKGAE